MIARVIQKFLPICCHTLLKPLWPDLHSYKHVQKYVLMPIYYQLNCLSFQAAIFFSSMILTGDYYGVVDWEAVRSHDPVSICLVYINSHQSPLQAASNWNICVHMSDTACKPAPVKAVFSNYTHMDSQCMLLNGNKSQLRAWL